MRFTMDFSLFSVLIPVYNMEKYIGKCIYSVLEQIYPNFEIIIIDNGSTDDSGRICDRYAKLDERIKVYHQRKQRLGIVRREAIERASGDFYLFLDGNDYWECDLLETLSRTIWNYNCDLLETLSKTIWNYNCDLVIFNYKYLGTDGVLKSNPIFEDGSLFDIYNKSRIFEVILNDDTLNKLYIFATKSTIIHSFDKPIQNSTIDFDYVYILPFIYKADRILYLDKPMYNHRMFPQRLANHFYINRINEITMIYKALQRYLELLNMNDKRHLQLFYNNFIRLVLGYISELSNSKISFIKKRRILHKIWNLTLYQNAIKYLDKSLLMSSEKILLYLLNQKHYNLIIIKEQKNKVIHCLLNKFKIY